MSSDGQFPSADRAAFVGADGTGFVGADRPTGDDRPAGWDDAAPPPRRFRRSARDRKLAGVAGGIGRALGVDPILIRVVFVVLTIFGGTGVGLYAAGWLLLPDDQDEASAAEALLGRGRSSVSPVLAVVLAGVVLVSVASAFTVGLKLLPAAAIAAAVFVVLGRKHSCHQRKAASRRPPRRQPPETVGRVGQRLADSTAEWSERAGAWGDDVSRRAERWGLELSRRAERWGAKVGRHAEEFSRRLGDKVGGHPHKFCGPAQRAPFSRSRAARNSGDDLVRHEYHHDPAATAGGSPFEQPAFWDRPDPDQPAPHPAAAHGDGADRVDLTKRPAADRETPATPDATVSPPRPPQWDPLGAAPFAWDLPEPPPAPPSAQELARRRRSSAITRVTLGAALLTGGLLVGGMFAGLWPGLHWSAISGAVLAVLAVGILLAALTGHRPKLIGPAVPVAVITVLLSVAGIGGVGDIGRTTWQPTTPQQAATEYHLQAGDAVLDLRRANLPAGAVISTSAEVNTGQLTVIVPAGATVNATCSANLGSVTCLGETADGFADERTAQQLGRPVGDRPAPVINLKTHVGLGQLEVRRG